MCIRDRSPRIRDKERKVRLNTGLTKVSTAFEFEMEAQQGLQNKTYSLSDISYTIKKKALNKLKFYRFSNLKKYFPHLESTSTFISDDKYLNPVKIVFSGTAAQVSNPSPEIILEATVKALHDISKEIQTGAVEYKGTKAFTPQGISYTFKDKLLNITVGEGSAEYGIAQSETTNRDLQLDLSTVDWYAFNENYGTDQEKYLVKYIEQAYQSLQAKYTDIYLLRNEKHFKLYAFEDGKPIEPDFVLFLKEQKTKQSLIYQIFIEPKGQQLLATDQWLSLIHI